MKHSKDVFSWKSVARARSNDDEIFDFSGFLHGYSRFSSSSTSSTSFSSSSSSLALYSSEVLRVEIIRGYSELRMVCFNFENTLWRIRAFENFQSLLLYRNRCFDGINDIFITLIIRPYNVIYLL